MDWHIKGSSRERLTALSITELQSTKAACSEKPLLYGKLGRCDLLMAFKMLLGTFWSPFSLLTLLAASHK